MGKKRKVPGINGSSSADIAFMLLLFFLLTTSMDTDKGLPRRLPQPPEDKEKLEEKFNKRNILLVLVSEDGRIMCGGDEVTLTQLRDKTKEFIDNPMNLESLPEKEEVDIPIFGKRMITTKHLISLQCHRTTKYQAYIDVQNELAAAITQLRDDASKKQFDGKKFSELNEEQMNAVKLLYPQHISEAEPQSYGVKTNKR
jgi:biopolymer transport protein ExbD